MAGGMPVPPRLLANSFAFLQVTWVEHMEIEQTLPISALYRNLVLSGAAFGAHRWLAALQRACERVGSLAMLGAPLHDLVGAGGTLPTPSKPSADGINA